MKKIKSLLIVNRGEIALKIIKTCKKLGIKSVAIYSKPDQFATFVLQADAAYALAESTLDKTYQDAGKILEIIKKSKVDAVHPGYGFLSEDGNFAQKVLDLGVIWVGPSPDTLHLVGNKAHLRKKLEDSKFKLIPGFSAVGKEVEHIKDIAIQMGFPVLLKAASGGGGKGLRPVYTAADLAVEMDLLKKEISQHLATDEFLIEKCFENIKHIEVQILADAHGNYLHAFERECSVQRRYQKIIEECPSPALTTAKRNEVLETAVEIANYLKLDQIATVEFIYDVSEEQFYFLEVNPRIQVEHTITECVTGLNLVAMQLHIATGAPISLKQSEIAVNGHAIQTRLCAESSHSESQPTTGVLAWLSPPKTDHGYMISSYKSGDPITHYYDNLIGKLVVHRSNREEALLQMSAFLRNTISLGIKSNQEKLAVLLDSEKMNTGTYTTNLTREWSLIKRKDSKAVNAIGICMTIFLWGGRLPQLGSLNGWRNIYYKPQENTFLVGGEKRTFKYRYLNGSFEFYQGQNRCAVEVLLRKGRQLILEIDGEKQTFFVVKGEACHYIKSEEFFNITVTEPEDDQELKDQAFVGLYVAPLAGEILDVYVKHGDKVHSGTHLMSLFSMKMEIKIVAETAGIVSKLHVDKGQVIEADQPLVHVENMIIFQN